MEILQHTLHVLPPHTTCPQFKKYLEAHHGEVLVYGDLYARVVVQVSVVPSFGLKHRTHPRLQVHPDGPARDLDAGFGAPVSIRASSQLDDRGRVEVADDEKECVLLVVDVAGLAAHLTVCAE